MWSYQTPGRKQLRWAQRHTLVIYKTRLQNLVLYSWVKKTTSGEQLSSPKALTLQKVLRFTQNSYLDYILTMFVLEPD